MSNKNYKRYKGCQLRLKPLLGLVLSFILSATPVYAESLIVLSRQLDSYQTVAESIAATLDAPSKITTLSELETDGFSTSNFQEVVAIGSKAADKLYSSIPAEQKLYASFLPRQTFLALLDKYKNHTRTRKKTITAIFLDQPYSRQLSLARLIVPQAKIVATALGPNSKNDLQLLESAANTNNFSLKHETLEETDNPIHKLQPLIRGADLFLSLPDKSVFNRTTAKWVLYISFRQRIPLIGFSKKYVDAGALAAVYSTPEGIGQQTAELINKTTNSKTLPAGQYPAYFSVATNPTAAKSLKVHLLPVDSIKAKIVELEK